MGSILRKGLIGRVHLFNTRHTGRTLPHPRQLYYTANFIGTSVAGEMVHFSQMKECYSSVASVELIDAPMETSNQEITESNGERIIFFCASARTVFTRYFNAQGMVSACTHTKMILQKHSMFPSVADDTMK